MFSASRLFILFVLLTSLVACGGGGGADASSDSSVASSSEPTPVSQPAPAPVSEPTPAPTPAPAPTPDPVPAPVPAPVPFSKTITVSWQVPTNRENGAPLTVSELGGYEIVYYREGSTLGEGGVEDISAMDGNGELVTSNQLTITEAGTWYFSISSYDIDGLKSALSNPIAAVIQ